MTGETAFDVQKFVDGDGLGELLKHARYDFRYYQWGHARISLRDVEAKTGINKSRLSRLEMDPSDIRVWELLKLLKFHEIELDRVQPLLSQIENDR